MAVSERTENTLYGGVTSRRVTIRDLQLAKERGERWPMLTAYDYSTARVFDEAGIPVLLVGDSAANVVYAARGFGGAPFSKGSSCRRTRGKLTQTYTRGW